MIVHNLKTPTGRTFQLVIAADGTRWIGAQLHKRELLSISVALDASRERMQENGNATGATRVRGTARHVPEGAAS